MGSRSPLLGALAVVAVVVLIASAAAVSVWSPWQGRDTTADVAKPTTPPPGGGSAIADSYADFYANQTAAEIEAQELRQWNCGEAWSFLTEEQANRLYGGARPERGVAPVPQEIQDLIAKYCD